MSPSIRACSHLFQQYLWPVAQSCNPHQLDYQSRLAARMSYMSSSMLTVDPRYSTRSEVSAVPIGGYSWLPSIV